MARAPQQLPQQQHQVVRLLGTNETRQVPIHKNLVQGWEHVVYWDDIREQFSHIKVAIIAEAGLDFQRDSHGQIMEPQRIKAQHPSEIIVQLDKINEDRLDVQTVQTVQSSIRALFDIPNHPIPRMFIIVPELKSKLNPTTLVYRSYRLFFLCECGDSVAAASSTVDGGISHHMHFAHHEGYQIRTPRVFIRRYGKHVVRLLNAVQVLATIGGNSSKLPSDMKKALGATDDKCLSRIKEIANHLQQVLKSTNDKVDAKHSQVLDGPELRAVVSFLIRKDESQTLGNLHRIQTPDYKTRWVCDQHVQENARVGNMEELRRITQTFKGTLDEKRGLVTVRLSSDNAVGFFRLIGRDSPIQELDITLDFGPTTEQIRTLRQHMKLSHVSSLTFNIDIPNGHYVFLGVIRKVAGVAQLLKLLELEKVGKPGPFRNLSIKGVSDFLEAYEYKKCLAHSLTLDRVSFRWENEKSRQRLLQLLGKAPDLSSLQLCSTTLVQGYDMANELAKASHQLKTIDISVQHGGRFEFRLKAGSIDTIAVTIHASELGVVDAWSDKIERLTVMAVDGDWFWPALQKLISQSWCLNRLDLHCPVDRFCSIFQRVKDAISTQSSLGTLCLHHGNSELLIADINNSTSTTTIRMSPGEERRLGFWKTFSLFGFVPSYDASPSQLTDEESKAIQDHFSQTNGPIRLKELNLDVSKLTCLGLMSLGGFLDQYKTVCVRLSGSWSRNCNEYIISSLGARISGFDMVVHLSGTNPLEKEAPALLETLQLVKKSVSIPGARLRFMTNNGNTIDIPDVCKPDTGYFNIIQEDEMFDFALTRYFKQLPPKLLCSNGFSDADAMVLQDLIVLNPDRLRYVSIPIHGLSPQTLRDLEVSISTLSKGAELKIHWNGSGLLDNTKLQACLHFISKVANRTCELDIENITSLGDCISDRVSDAPPIWSVLQSVSLRHIQTTEWFSTWMQWMAASKKLHSVHFVSLLNIDPVQWNNILKDMPFHTLKSVRIKSSRLPADLLKVIVGRIPPAGGDLKTLDVECHEKPKRTWYRKKKKPANRFPFELEVLSKAPNCVVTVVYNWKK
ncbi:hypothetical protein KI688_006821 [Linnemannia hyalina]|uniref:Uncharacterized protein n=1 Tax=Linnemannia hyalina TaxID=64524 RepID=A0A9P8BNR1_9FUNG|nr:hypothetical protein KI688_006821 [Linnemannia hyalina]